ncbi:unnamed protein product [Bursaphelenchus okinawaensis]|uniref:Uncharacterized protein n=1 Tax=Bursaphelenchus okinawaensis TaxID=465554 RepID=A0A811L145_9BILA|nr:unnamed protein product [Bursaphelenchus okinawaensis]CAG9114854.1 unnamed protein product [Bursaphelenchus okinawaensis]
MAGNGPKIQLNVDLDDILNTTLGLIVNVNDNVGTIAGAVEYYMKEPLNGTVHDVAKIVNNIQTITQNMAASSNTFYQPLLLILALIIVVLLLLSICLFCMLRTRREYKKHPIRFRLRKKKQGRPAPRVPEHTSTETIDDVPPGYSAKPKKKDDTLV